jgi:diguanylate cyclase
MQGDAVLKTIAAHISGSGRRTDKLGRYGGEEFLMVFPATGIDEGVAVMERARETVSALAWPEVEEPLRVTFSCGITEIQPGDTVDEAVSRADQAMYDAKRGGRNRVSTRDFWPESAVGSA